MADENDPNNQDNQKLRFGDLTAIHAMNWQQALTNAAHSNDRSRANLRHAMSTAWGAQQADHHAANVYGTNAAVSSQLNRNADRIAQAREQWAKVQQASMQAQAANAAAQAQAQGLKAQADAMVEAEREKSKRTSWVLRNL